MLQANFVFDVFCIFEILIRNFIGDDKKKTTKVKLNDVQKRFFRFLISFISLFLVGCCPNPNLFALYAFADRKQISIRSAH